MKVAVLGTGMVGTAIVHELARTKSSNIDEVIAVDSVQKNLDRCLHGIEHPKVSGKVAMVGEHEALVKILQEADLAIACLPHALSLPAIEAAIEAKCHLVDLVGSKYVEKLALNEQAKEAGVIIVPGCGVAPGIVSFLAARGVELLDEAYEAVMLCGGLPRYPVPPLWYQIVFRFESVMGLYTRRPMAAENGEVIELVPFSGKEIIGFPDPVGDCEAIYSDAHSVAYTLKNKVKRVYEKTIRYKGHFEKMRVLSELGFLNDDPIAVENQFVSPKQFTMALLEPQLTSDSKEDITVLRAIVEGKKNDQHTTLTWEMIDFYDAERNITSMAKTTGFPAIIMAAFIAEGKVSQRGIVAPEEIVVGDLFDPFLLELKNKGIHISFTEEVHE